MPQSPVTVVPREESDFAVVGRGIQQGIQNFFQTQQIKQKQQQIDNQRKQAEVAGKNASIMAAAQAANAGLPSSIVASALEPLSSIIDTKSVAEEMKKNDNLYTGAVADVVDQYEKVPNTEITTAQRAIFLATLRNKQQRKELNDFIDDGNKRIREAPKRVAEQQKFKLQTIAQGGPDITPEDQQAAVRELVAMGQLESVGVTGLSPEQQIEKLETERIAATQRISERDIDIQRKINKSLQDDLDAEKAIVQKSRTTTGFTSGIGALTPSKVTEAKIRGDALQALMDGNLAAAKAAITQAKGTELEKNITDWWFEQKIKYPDKWKALTGR